MDIIERAERDCQFAIKAVQNVKAAQFYMRQLCRFLPEGDALLLSSLFLTAVIRYCRPFTQTGTGVGSITFPSKPLKNILGFNPILHEHLLHLRNRLLAHDDLEIIQPPLMTTCLEPQGTAISIPMEINMTNKCLGFPATLDLAKNLELHVSAALEGVDLLMNQYLERFRALMIANPKAADDRARTRINLGLQTITAEGVRTTPPDVSGHPFLVTREPDFQEIQGEYRYETIHLKRQFRGPEVIDLGNGETIVIGKP